VRTPQDSIIVILDALYRDRDYARFFVLETIARVPYFGEGLLLHACDNRQIAECCSTNGLGMVPASLCC
jgi:hypothetical protein